LLDKSELAHDAVRSLLISHPSGIHLIAAPVTPTQDASLRETQIVAMADTLARRAEFVIVDAPPVLNPMCIGALKAADRVILAMTPEIASIQTTAATLRVLVKLGISGKKVHLVLNHPHSGGWLPKEAAERGVNRKISFSIPYDSEQNRALAQGSPLALGKPESPLPSAMMNIAAALKQAV
jgi:pilus assembly protein CpaE